MTLGDIRKALTNEQLQSLLDNEFDPIIEVKIEVSNFAITRKKKLSKFAEDRIALSPTVSKRRGGKKHRQKVEKSLTETYGGLYKKWKKNKSESPDASIAFGCYLYLYHREFEEEDPEWAGVRPTVAINKLNRMAKDLTKGNFEPIIDFAERLIPAWANQLRKGAAFPTNRPTFEGLFVRRKIWAQRFNYVRQWR